MPIESASFVNQLNQAYPAATDGVKEGDDHIRLVKKVLKDTFPNVGAAVTKTAAELNYMPREFPIGGIIMWSGAIGSLPTNFVLCNGQTVARSDGAGNITTPDLRDRFIVGAGLGYSVGATGGANGIFLTESQLPPHNHNFGGSGTTSSAGSHSHTINDPGHSHTYLSIDTAGTGTMNVAGPSFGYGYTGSSQTGISINANGSHTHSFSFGGTTANSGGGASIDNRPPYYALAFIMRI